MQMCGRGFRIHKAYKHNVRPFDFLIMSRKDRDDQYMINVQDGFTSAGTSEARSCEHAVNTRGNR